MKRMRLMILGLTVLLTLVMISAVLAAGDGIHWYVFSGGGAPASAGDVNLNASLGQSVIGNSASTDGQVQLSAGFWQPQESSAKSYQLMLPLLVR